jgi:cysteine dioxygenase
MTTIEDFAERLSAIAEHEFTHEGVLEFLRRHPVSIQSLEPYLYFCAETYTRNLIRKTALFDLLAICWEPGQKSSVHNHRDQNCWMAIAYGRVQVQNFRLVSRGPATGFCELAPTSHFIIDAERPAEVDPEEPIHLVANPASFGSRAVTLHVYSRPFDTCEIYDIKNRRYEVVKLTNTSEFGVLTSSRRAEKLALA